MDLSHSHINSKARIVAKGTGKVSAAKQTSAFMNSSSHFLFSNLKVKNNENEVSGGDENYHFIAYAQPPSIYVWCEIHTENYGRLLVSSKDNAQKNLMIERFQLILHLLRP